MSNLTLNSAKASANDAPVGTFNTFSLNEINQIRNVRFKGTCSMGAYSSSYGVTIFSYYVVDGSVILLRMNGAKYTNFEIDLIIPATIEHYLNSSGKNEKLISCIGSPARSRSNLATSLFSESSPPSVYTNDLYTHSFSCNIDMYLEVIE